MGCGRCAGVLGDGLPDGFLCPSCRRRPPPFACTVTLGGYTSGEALREWVLAFKHGGRRDLAPILGAALGTVIGEVSLVALSAFTLRAAWRSAPDRDILWGGSGAGDSDHSDDSENAP